MRFDPVALANDVPDASSFERATLDHLQRIVGFDAAFFAGKDDVATGIGVDGHELDAAIASGTFADELAPLKAFALARKGVAVDTQVLGEPRARALRYHRRFAAPIGGQHSLLAFLRVRGNVTGALMLGRSGGTFSGEDIQRIEELLPQLAVARASFRLPWRGDRLPTPPSSATARLRQYLHGQHVHERSSERAPALLVRDRAGFREMVASDERGELVWSRSAIAEPERSGWFYLDLLHLAAVRAPSQRRFLFVGAGGGVSVRQFARLYPGATLDVVEPDARVIDLARRWFGLASVPNLTVTIDDGATFLRRAPSATWDAVIVDAYDGSKLASSLARRPFFADVRRSLRHGGGMAFNVIGSLAGHEVRSIERAARAARLDVRLVPVLDPGESFSQDSIRNIVILGRRSH